VTLLLTMKNGTPSTRGTLAQRRTSSEPNGNRGPRPAQIVQAAFAIWGAR
jgi:hypothetical protein